MSSTLARGWICCLALWLPACASPATSPEDLELAPLCDPLESQARALPDPSTLALPLKCIEENAERHFQVFRDADNNYRLFTYDLKPGVWQELKLYKVLVQDTSEQATDTYLVYQDLGGTRSVLAYTFAPGHLQWAGFADTNREIQSPAALEELPSFHSLVRMSKFTVPNARDAVTTELPRSLRFVGNFGEDQTIVVVETKDASPGLYIGQGNQLQGVKELKVMDLGEAKNSRFHFVYDGKQGTLDLPASPPLVELSRSAAVQLSLTLGDQKIELRQTEFQPSPARIKGLEFRHCEDAHQERP